MSKWTLHGNVNDCKFFCMIYCSLLVPFRNVRASFCIMGKNMGSCVNEEDNGKCIGHELVYNCFGVSHVK